MSRIVLSTNADELAKPSIVGCVLVDLDFASGHVYLNDGIQEILFNSHTYSPLGQFGGIESVDEGLDTLARPLKLTLSGVDAALIAPAETEIYQNRSATVYLAFVNQATGVLVATPEIAWEGRMDYMEITLDKNKGTIMLNCEHRLRREPRISRYTDADQQTAFSGDDFFNFTGSIVGFKSQWGSSTVQWGGPTRGGVGGPGPHGGGGQRSGSGARNR